MMLNKTRTNVSMAFQSLQKISSHTLQDYAAHVVSDPPLSGVEPRLSFPCRPCFFVQKQQYPLLPEAEVQSKAHIWKTFDDTEQQRRQAMYKDVLAQQHSVGTS